MIQNKFKRIIKISIIILSCLLIACSQNEPTPPYVYNNHPTFTWGKIEYYGNYYGNYDNPNNVVTLSLFSDSIIENESGEMIGIGQQLILEDVFIANTDTLLPPETYTMSETKEKFTFVPGRIVNANNENEILGARITYLEKNTKKSITRLITNGSFSVISNADTTINIDCNFTTLDKIQIKGSFKGKLKFYNKSISKIH